MPAVLEDPTAPIIYRNPGGFNFNLLGGPLPPGIAPRHVTLRDRVTTATVIPFSAPNQVPLTLLAYLCDQLGREIEKGDTYPMIDPLPLDSFGPYWFGVFGAIMLLGEIQDGREIHEMARRGCDWERACLGSFYIKPNYPGRSSHVCNGGFLVTDASRNRGVGRLMGELYLDWAPKLGYTYSVFNLVYETNVASCRIWDALGFKRLGRVKGGGSLKSYPGELVDAIIYGRDLGQDDDFVSEERFDKIRFYLKNGKYPNGADRAEKSRLRSAATHYKLLQPNGIDGERLMLKGKEVISDPQRQYDIAREVHHKSHGGINKTTAAIAESYHWVRIKETVSQVIRNCSECSEMNKGLSTVRVQQTRYTQLSDSSVNLGASTPSGDLVSTHALPLQRTEPQNNQLQLQTSQQFTGFPVNHNDYEMPLDPALMEGVNPPLSLEDLPPSPFLSAGYNLSPGLPLQQLPGLELTPSDRQSHAPPDGISPGIEGRVPDAKEDIQRRTTRMGLRRAKHD